MLKLVMMTALAASAIASAAVAQESHSLSKTYMDCHGRAHGNTVQESMCAQAELSGQDARLNKAYQQVMHQLDKEPAKKTALRDEERSWLKRRDYECKVDGHTVNESCVVAKTAQRADELEKQVRF